MAHKLSHSQVGRHMQCPKSYELWYIKKFRSVQQSAALLFGTALDRAVGVLLEPKKDSKKTPEDIFDYFWRFQDINGKNTYIPTLADLVYSKSDFDEDLLTDEAVAKIGESREHILKLRDVRDELNYKGLTEKERSTLNHAIWWCMYEKGHIMIDALRTKVLPKLTHIHSTQEYVELINDEGDKVIGYIDIVANVEGYDEPIILDLKTSAMRYKDDAVLENPQLALYTHALSDKYKTNKAGFIVLNKQLVKNKTKICSKCGHDGTGGRHKTCDNVVEGARCNGKWNETMNPEAVVQFIISEVPQATQDIVLENMQDITTSIKTGHYTRNLNSCNNWYGGPCSFKNYCWYGKTDDIILPESGDGV